MAPREGGAVDTDGIEQYARHGKGSLSGFKTWIRRRVSKMATMVRIRSVKSYNKTIFSTLSEEIKREKFYNRRGRRWE